MKLSECNPFLRAAQIQPAVLEGKGPRMAYDHRLFYILEGAGTLILGENEIAVSPDTLIFIPPRFGYFFRGKMRAAVLNFDLTRAFTVRTKPICPPPVDLFDPALCFDPTTAEELPRPLVIRGDTFLRERFLEITTTFSERKPLADAATSAALKLLLTEMLSRTGETGDAEHALAVRVYGYIRLHAAEITDNGELAAAFGYHPVYIGTVFRKKTGKTLHAAILEERLRLACRLLLQTDRSVDDIAESTGFSSRSHFCTAFRAAMGATPRAYRATTPRVF